MALCFLSRLGYGSCGFILLRTNSLYSCTPLHPPHLLKRQTTSLSNIPVWHPWPYWGRSERVLITPFASCRKERDELTCVLLSAEPLTAATGCCIWSQILLMVHDSSNSHSCFIQWDDFAPFCGSDPEKVNGYIAHRAWIWTHIISADHLVFLLWSRELVSPSHVVSVWDRHSQWVQTPHTFNGTGNFSECGVSFRSHLCSKSEQDSPIAQRKKRISQTRIRDPVLDI